MRYLIVLLLAGCATTDMVKLAEPRTVVIEWVREKPTFCGEGTHAGMRGCAKRSLGYKTCTIWATEDVPDEVLGHELRHCFGYEHAGALKKRAQK